MAPVAPGGERGLMRGAAEIELAAVAGRERKGEGPPGWWVLRFAIALAAFDLFRWGFYSSSRLYGVLAPLDALTAGVTAEVLTRLGVEVERAGAVLGHPDGFRYAIYYRCTGLIVAAFFAVGLLALPGRLRSKLLGIVFGAAALLALNVVRLTGLFWVGVYRHPAFGIVHVAGEASMLAAVLGLWLAWLRWSGSSVDRVSS